MTGKKILEEYRVDDSVGYLLNRARLKLAKAFDDVLAEYEITHAQGGIILMLATGKYETAAELVRELYSDSASMTRMIDRLEKRGLVQRVRRSDDRRAVSLRLTAQGRALSRKLPQVYAAQLAASFSVLSATEIDTLRGLLRKFLGDDPQAAANDHPEEHE
ncbi:MAG TPA: MarR family transcriptional regulator [Noviherbaspirillum sp.]|jgi:DNA-binding MarR family transcriptional regulator|uniref:MarR family winged helix-turn-helix transcriptional regulator n=1 Tax=Noviherbaspirillum sp. TaxID=1926288 RepID=UPI002F953ADB